MTKAYLQMAVCTTSTWVWIMIFMVVSTRGSTSNSTEMWESIYMTEEMPTGFYLSDYSDVYATVPDGGSAGLGWEWHPLDWRWWVVLQAVSSILGIVGNGVVMRVIYQRIASSRSTDSLIGALAVADFLTSAFLFPIPWAERVPGTVMGNFYCKLLYPSFFLWLSITASTYILMAICIERYMAVVHPLYFNRIITRRKINICVIGIWVISFLQLGYSLITFVQDANISYCYENLSDSGKQIKAFIVFGLRMVIPVLTMLITQILVARSLQQQAKRFAHMASSIKENINPSFHVVAKNRVIKMMLQVVIVYVITWTPNQIAYLCFNLGYITGYRGSPLHRILTVLAFVNSCANPFIYAARMRSFREAVKNLFFCTNPSTGPLFEARCEKTPTFKSVADLQLPVIRTA